MLRKGKAAVDAETVVNKPKGADPYVVWVLIAKTGLDVLAKNHIHSLWSCRCQCHRQFITNCVLIGTERKTVTYKDTERFFHPATGTRQKNTVLKAFNKAGIEWLTWNRTVHHKVERWLLDIFMRATGWLTIETRQKSKLRKCSVLVYKSVPRDARHHHATGRACGVLSVADAVLLRLHIPMRHRVVISVKSSDSLSL